MLLLGREQKPVEVIRSRNFASCGQLDMVSDLPNPVEDSLPGLVGQIFLFVIPKDGLLPLFHIATIRTQLAGNQIQQGGLAEAVATDDADAVPFDKIVGEIPDQMPIPVALAQVGYFQNFATQRPTCSVQFQFAGHLTVGDFVLDFVELIDAGFGLSPPGLGLPAHPFQLFA